LFASAKNVCSEISHDQECSAKYRRCNVESINVIDLDFKNYYIVFTLKISVRMKSDTRYVALLNTEAEINIMTEEMMQKKDLSMRSCSALNLIFYIDH
jgi:hypothetical protein